MCNNWQLRLQNINVTEWPGTLSGRFHRAVGDAGDDAILRGLIAVDHPPSCDRSTPVQPPRDGQTSRAVLDTLARVVEYKIGSKGTRVTELQEALVAHGYSLPKWGADGELGWETWLALLAFAQGRGLAAGWPQAEAGTGVVPDPVVASLFASVDDGPPRLIDLTRLHKLEKGRPEPRAPATVTGIVLHQTATRLGSNHARWYNVACHVGIPPSGEILYVNDILAYVWHANDANRFSIGIEIDGRFEGVLGVRKTLWRYKDGRVPDVLSTKQITAARAAIKWLVQHGKERGCPVTEIHAHRQFSDQRRSDPGSAIWKEVGVWAQNEVGLQLKCRPSFTLGTGLALPAEWDPAGTVDYYGKKKK